jgi:hypothetical protein
MALALSAGLHAAVYFWGYAAPRLTHPPVELDLTMSGHLGHLGGGRAARPAAPPPPPPAAKAAPKEWVKAADNKPAPLPDLAKESAAPSAPEPAPAQTPGPPGPASNEPPGEYGEACAEPKAPSSSTFTSTRTGA